MIFVRRFKGKRGVPRGVPGVPDGRAISVMLQIHWVFPSETSISGSVPEAFRSVPEVFIWFFKESGAFRRGSEAFRRTRDFCHVANPLGFPERNKHFRRRSGGVPERSLIFVRFLKGNGAFRRGSRGE